MDRQKENQNKIVQLEQKSKPKPQFLNAYGYESWNTEELIQWIMYLENGRFSKYRDIFAKRLLEQRVCGKHLSKINVLHIRGWGVNNFEDNDLLMNKITALINKND